MSAIKLLSPTSVNSTNSIAKLVFVLPKLHTGGAERQLLMLLRGLSRSKFEPTVVALSPGGDLADAFTEVANVYVFPRRYKSDLRPYFCLAKLLREIQPAIVHGWLWMGNTAAALSVALSARRVPLLLSVRGLEHVSEIRYKRIIRTLLGRFAGRKATKVICNTKTLIEVAIKQYGVGPENIVIYPNGLHLDYFSDVPSPSPQDPPTVGIIARLTPVKGHSIFLKALSRTLNIVPDIKAIIIGDGPLRLAIESEIEQLNLADRVELVGNADDIRPYLSRCHFTVLSSLSEGCPNSVIESLATGRPVIATRVGGLPELIDDGIDGLLVAPDSSEELANAMIHMASSTSLRHEMGLHGMQKVRTRFSKHTMVEAYEHLYTSTLESAAHFDTSGRR